jgi:hypothetical protein
VARHLANLAPAATYSVHTPPPGAWGPNPRELLTAGEERRTLGITGAAAAGKAVGMAAGTTVSGRLPPPPSRLRRELYRAIDIPESLPVGAAHVTDVEARLCGLVVAPDGGAGVGRRAPPPYPLADLFGADGAGGGASGGSPGGSATPLHEEMHRELADSWAEHHLRLSLEDLALAPHFEDQIIALQVRLCCRVYGRGPMHIPY